MSSRIYFPFILLCFIYSGFSFSNDLEEESKFNKEFTANFEKDVQDKKAILTATSSYLLRDEIEHIFVTYKMSHGGQIKFDVQFKDVENPPAKVVKRLEGVMDLWLSGVIIGSQMDPSRVFTLYRMQRIDGKIYFVNYIKQAPGSNLGPANLKLLDNGSDFMVEKRVFSHLLTNSRGSLFSSKIILGNLTNDEKNEVINRLRNIIKMKVSAAKKIKLAAQEFTLQTGKVFSIKSTYVVDGQSLASYKQHGLQKGGILSQKIDNFNLKGYEPKEVLTWDYNENKTTYQPILRKFMSNAHELLVIYVDGKKKPIKTTPNHPFYVDGKGWVPAGKLISKDKLVHGDGSRINVKRTELEKLKNPIAVVNFEVAGFNNYFVQAGENGKSVLVHNCDPEELDPETPDNKNIAEGYALNPNKHEATLVDHICFPKETFIRVEDGGYKLISEVREGDSVLSCNDDESVCHYRRVLETTESVGNEFMQVRTPSMGSYPIQSTLNHPFYLADENRYKMAAFLTPGEVLQYETFNGVNKKEEIESVDYTKLEQPVTVYNLKVEEFENYYVAPATGDLSHPQRFYKVHNCSLGLDLTPGVGEVKSLIEAWTAKNYVGEDLDTFDRFVAGIGAIPGAGKLLKATAKAIRAEKKIAKSAQVATKLEKVAVEAEKRGAKVGGKSNSAKKFGTSNAADTKSYANLVKKIGEHSPKDIVQFEKLKAGLAVQEIKGAKVIGSAMKDDAAHRSASFMLDIAAKEGKVTSLKGGDGVVRNLLQVEGSLNSQKGIYEWIVGPGGLTHQRFIKGGKMTGFPNQVPKNLP